MLAMQVPCHLSHVANPFCFSYFSNRVLLLCLADLDRDPAICDSHVAEVSGAHHHAQLFLVEMGVLITICLDLS
jgi:hypothetical protein